MESNKRSYSEIDPDYIFPDNAKIGRFSGEFKSLRNVYIINIEDSV